jgi:hypothetical protein
MVIRESLHGTAQHGFSGQDLILLGKAEARPLAFAGGDDQDGGTRHGGSRSGGIRRDILPYPPRYRFSSAEFAYKITTIII